MTANDAHEPEDLLSRRLSSQPEGDEPTAAQLAADSAATEQTERSAAPGGVDAGASGGAKAPHHLEDTQAFDPFPGATPRAAARTQPEHDESSPTSVLSAEDWALINDAPAPAAAPVPVAAGAPATTDSEAGPRRTALDVIGAVWIALSIPFIVAGLSVRAVASGTFLAWTYFWRPGFPEDQYGFTAEDRLHFGSYTVDYLYNLDSSRYLADIVGAEGAPLFTAGEVSHMQDVKQLIGLLTLIAIIGAVGSIAFGLYKCRARGTGMRGSLRIGSVLTVALFAALGVLALVGWDQFFTGFHDAFFAEGTWTFYLDDSLIRLFPPQFWVDAGIAALGIALLLCAFGFVLSFVGRGRRRRRR